MLFVDDLLNAYDLAIANIKTAAGNVYQSGWGKHRMFFLSGRNLNPFWKNVSDILCMLSGQIGVPVINAFMCLIFAKHRKNLAGSPKISVEEGIQKLHDWVKTNIHLFQ